MLLVPLIRSGRAISGCLLFPEHPIAVITASEFISVLAPMINPDMMPKILGTIYALLFNPTFAYYYIEKYNNITRLYNQAEICSLLLFIVTVFSIKYI